jgi:hypothetical protein
MRRFSTWAARFAEYVERTMSSFLVNPADRGLAGAGEVAGFISI